MVQNCDKIPDIRKIAVLRANGLGDFLLSLPALEALRETYRTAEIVLLGQEWHARFLMGRPGPIDRVAIVPPARGVTKGNDFKEDRAVLHRFFAAMRAEHFDLALQMHGGGRFSNAFLLQLGARITAGSGTPDAARLDRAIPYIYFQSEVMRYKEIASLAGASSSALEPCITVTDADLQESYTSLPPTRELLAILHPSVADNQRRWPASKFAEVGDALAAAGARVAITGTETERDVVQETIFAMHAEATDLSGSLSLNGLAGLFSRSSVLVANDSGPMHLAAAAGSPTVGLYWCFNLVTAGLLTRLRHRPLISWRVNCPVCGRNRSNGRCEHRESFVAEIPVDRVIEAALDLLRLPDSRRDCRRAFP